MAGARSLHRVRVERDVAMPMRDGVVLRADIYRPEGRGPFPVLLLRSPYEKSLSQYVALLHPEWYARHGFIVVSQDSRGRFASDGIFRPYHHEGADTVDSIAFCRTLGGASGKVGMYGFSYPGALQLEGARARPEGLVAIAPAFANDGCYEGWTYRGGALQLAFVQSWAAFLALGELPRQGRFAALRPAMMALNTIPLQYDHLPLDDHPVLDREAAAFYYEWLAHPVHDAYWKAWDLAGHYHEIDVPALHIGGWYDIFLDGMIRNFEGLTQGARSDTARRGQKLVIGPWYHMPWAPAIGELDFGEAGRNRTDELLVRWYARWLKGADDGISGEPPVSVFVMGANRWRHAKAWPIPGTRLARYYLHSGGRANAMNGDGRLARTRPGAEPEDIFVSDPFNPIPSLGGRSCCIAALTPMGPKDQRPVEIRNDVLVYTSARLAEDVEVIGPVDAVLYAASSADDTDFTVKLVDVYPDGRAINLVDGIIRASFREDPSAPSAIAPGKVYRYAFRVGHTGNLFRRGHRIRVEIASTSFPAYERTLNRFHPEKNATYADIRTATNRVFHDRERPSHIVLPVIPRRGPRRR